MTQPSIEIRPDILEKYRSLFGTKVVNGHAVSVEALIARLTLEMRDEFRELLIARHTFQGMVGRREQRYGFLPGPLRVSDADGHSATVGEIRQGMLDHFFNHRTPIAWRLNPTVPIPPDTTTPGLEGTGPSIDLGMAMGALNSGAAQWMWDWEDAAGDFRQQLYQAWQNLSDILAHKWDDRPFLHPSKLELDAQGKPIPGRPRKYTIDLPPAKWPTIFHRVPGLHLRNRQITMNGDEVPAIIPASIIHALNNYESQNKNGSGIYYYIPKV